MAGSRPGPAPTPSEVLRRRGGHGHGWRVTNESESQVAILPGQVEPPEPPRKLNKAGRQLWDRVWATANIWLSPQTDVEALFTVCCLVDEFEKMRRLPVASRGAQWARDYTTMSNAIGRQLGDLGLNPSARSSLGVAEVRVDDPLEAFRKKRSS